MEPAPPRLPPLPARLGTGECVWARLVGIVVNSPILGRDPNIDPAWSSLCSLARRRRRCSGLSRLLTGSTASKRRLVFQILSWLERAIRAAGFFEWRIARERGSRMGCGSSAAVARTRLLRTVLQDSESLMFAHMTRGSICTSRGCRSGCTSRTRPTSLRRLTRPRSYAPISNVQSSPCQLGKIQLVRISHMRRLVASEAA